MAGFQKGSNVVITIARAPTDVVLSGHLLPCLTPRLWKEPYMVIIPILQLRLPIHREAKSMAQSHTIASEEMDDPGQGTECVRTCARV